MIRPAFDRKRWTGVARAAGVRHAARYFVACLAALAMALAATGPAEAQIHPNTVPPLKTMHVDLNNKAALRMGAMYVMHQCAACHSIQGARYSELAKPLGLTTDQVLATLTPKGKGIFDVIHSSMPDAVAMKFFNTPPPDLTVISRRHSADWLYTYLTSFYVDPKRFTGANNVVFHNVAMPDIFAGMQGLQKPVKIAGFRNDSAAEVAIRTEPLTQGSMTPQQFDQMTRDIVTFLYYLGHPHQQASHALGRWILIVLAVLIVLTYAIYRLYWRRVKHPSGGRWWNYWKS